ncbi:MAG: hypothetical protein ABJ056_02960 [Halioglobus sp.]
MTDLASLSLMKILAAMTIGFAYAQIQKMSEAKFSRLLAMFLSG